MKWLISFLALTCVNAVHAGESAATESNGEIMIYLLLVLVISIFLGFEVISKVPSLLHTPLMSGSNAISGITILGSMIAAGLGADHEISSLIGGFAVGFAMINVVGGYLVTDRMLLMFKKKDNKGGGTK